MSRCKDCVAEGVTTIRRAPHPGPRCVTHHRRLIRDRRARAHDLRVQAIYGLAEGDYDRLYEFQDGRCAGCRRAKGLSKRLAVDHNHSSGEVRGLLCGPCNEIVAYFRDDPSTFQRLADYLVRPPARRWRESLAVEPRNESDGPRDEEADGDGHGEDGRHVTHDISEHVSVSR